MGWLQQLTGKDFDFITAGIHCYACVALILVVQVFFYHRWRLRDLARRLGVISAQIEGRGSMATSVPLEQMTSVILHLADVVERKSEVDILPVLQFVRHEERLRGTGVATTLVNVTETMIELFPMLGILGTVWGIAGVGKEDFSSSRLLFLFSVATTTTLWALVYVILFRIVYSALVQGNVLALAEHNERFRVLLQALERRCDLANPVIGGATT